MFFSNTLENTKRESQTTNSKQSIANLMQDKTQSNIVTQYTPVEQVNIWVAHREVPK